MKSRNEIVAPGTRARLLEAFVLVGAVVPARACAVASGSPDARPNVVLIVADDMGYSDMVCYGGKDMSTPRLDALAAQGVRLTSGYVSGPICAPARAGLMTGRYQSRFGYEGYSGTVEQQVSQDRGVATSEILLPEFMRRAGYATSVIGKWHLGVNEKYRPTRRGADHFFGFLAGGHDYFEWDQAFEGSDGGPIWRDDEPAEGEGYITEAFTREAVAFIEEERDEPFFLYLAYFNIHAPFQVPDEYLPAREGEPGRERITAPARATIVGMVHALDRGVGEILDALDRARLADDTLVVFVNDNGSPFEPTNAPFSGNKGTLMEGGVRVPFFLRWPGHLEAGARYDRPIIALDLLPTLVALAGGELPSDRAIDGVDVLPFLTGTAHGDPHDALFWRFDDTRAVRSGDLKLHLARDGTTRLYDLAHDLGEKVDLASARPDDVARLRASLEAWTERVANDE